MPTCKEAHVCLVAELKASLSSFVEKETRLGYDQEAELALQRLSTGAADVEQLSRAWARSYAEVPTNSAYL